MARVKGLSHKQLNVAIDRIDGIVDDAIKTALESATVRLNGQVLVSAVATDNQTSVEPSVTANAITIDDLGSIAVVWQQQVSDIIMPVVGEIYRDSAKAISKSITRHSLLETVPEVPATQTEYQLTRASNRLRNVGDHIWNSARNELIEGVKSGESSQELATRLTGVHGFTRERALTIARTEVIGASNAGSLDQVTVAGLIGQKEWLATNDDRTRETHRRADGQKAEIDSVFHVGESLLKYPGDPTGSAEEVINCRCTLVYDLDAKEGFSMVAASDPLAGLPNVEGVDMPIDTGIPDNSQPAESAVDATESDGGIEDYLPEVHTGAMIALVPSAEDIARLVLDGGEAADQLHLTLFYLGEAADVDLATQARITASIVDTAQMEPVISAEVFGAALWNPQSETPAVVLNVGGENNTLENVRWTIEATLNDVWTSRMPEQHCPWIPHICLAYSDQLSMLSQAIQRVGSVVFDRVRVAWADVVTDVPLYGMGNIVASQALEAGTMPNTDQFAWDGGVNEKRLPSPLPVSKAKAAYAYVDTTQVKDGEVPKGACKLLHHDVSADGSVGVANVDGCSAAIGAIHGARSDLKIPADAKKTAYNHLAKHLRDAGKVPPDFAVWLASGSTTMEPVETESIVEPLADFSGSRWVGVLAVEGIETGDGRTFAPGSLTWDQTPFPLRWTPTDSGEHKGAVVVGRIDEVWRDAAQPSIIRGRGVFDDAGVNGAEALRLLGDRFLKGVSIDVDSIKDADVELVFPNSGNGESTQDSEDIAAMMFDQPESMIFHSGRIRAATLVDIPAFTEAQIWLDDGSVDVMFVSMNTMDSMTPTGEGVSYQSYEDLTAGLIPVDEDAPPASWFGYPDELIDGPTPLTITDDGRIYGHGALWGTCHTGFADACISPPHETDHVYFRQGELVTLEGTRVAVGHITLGTGHAPTFGIDPRKAVEHYDNTGTVVADVVSGNDEYGIWISGSIRSGLSINRIRELRASKLSGDWRRIGGNLRLVAFLAVNVPGFAVPRLRTEIKESRQLSLVAAGVIMDSPERTKILEERRALDVIRNSLQRRLHRTPKDRVAALRARVYKGQ